MIPPEIFERLLAADASIRECECDGVTLTSPPASHGAPLSESPEPVTQRKPEPVAAPAPSRKLTPRGTMIMDLTALLASRNAASSGTPAFRMGMASAAPGTSRSQTLLGMAAIDANGSVSAVAEQPPDSVRVRQLLDEMSMIIDVGALQRRIESASEIELEAIVERLRKGQGIDARSLESVPPPAGASGAPVRLPAPAPLPILPIPASRGSDPDLAWAQGTSSPPPPMPSVRPAGRTAYVQPKKRSSAWGVALAGATAAVLGVVGASRMFGDVRMSRALEQPIGTESAQASEATPSETPVTEAQPTAAETAAPAAPAQADGRTASVDEEPVGDDPELVPPPPSMTARERQRLEEAFVVARAEKALAKGDANAALSMLERAERRFPESTAALADAREALRIEALATAGRSDEAAGRAARFVEKFPTSRYKERVISKLAPAVPVAAPAEAAPIPAPAE